MAKPRVFVSSTFLDLRQIRADIEIFLREIGFEGILFEHGHIPYSSERALEQSAYTELQRCDILVAIIGSKYGTQSAASDVSITQHEISEAIALDRPVFIFVEQDTLTEYRTWENNKENKGVKYVYADNTKIFEFISNLYSIKKNNPIFPFRYASNIVGILKEQFAGLFQEMLSQKNNLQTVSLIGQLREMISSVENIMLNSSTSDPRMEGIISSLLSINHPIFEKIQLATNTPYRVFFTSLEEMERWLKARQWAPADFSLSEDHYEYDQQRKDKVHSLQVAKTLFDEHHALKPLPSSDWRDEMVKKVSADVWPRPKKIDDDIPF